MSFIVVCNSVVSQEVPQQNSTMEIDFHAPETRPLESNFDNRGVKRGLCEDCPHECNGFEVFPSDNICNYCRCPTVKHRRIGDGAGTSKESDPQRIRTESENSDFIVPQLKKNKTQINPENTDSDQEDEPEKEAQGNENNVGNQEVDPASADQRPNIAAPVASCSVLKEKTVNTNQDNSRSTQIHAHKEAVNQIVCQLTKNELYKLCVPCVIPPETEARIKQHGYMTSHERQFILRWISQSMQNFTLKSDVDYIQVATLAVQTYPAIAMTKNSGVSGIVASLKEILRNRNYYQSKKEKERLQESSVVSSVVRDKQLEKNKKAIHEEMEKPSPSKSVLKGNLNECRMERQALAKKQSYGDHIKDFPCLKLPDLIMWEFIQQERLHLSKDDMKMTWLNATSKMIKYFTSKQRTISPTLTGDLAAVEVLLCMTGAAYFGPKVPPEKRKRNSNVLELFEEGTILHRTIPDKEDPPRLIAIGDPAKENLSCHIYVDCEPVFTGTVLDSLLHLVAQYYVFDIAPTSDSKASFAFLFGLLLGDHAHKYVKKYRSVQKALDYIERADS